MGMSQTHFQPFLGRSFVVSFKKKNPAWIWVLVRMAQTCILGILHDSGASVSWSSGSWNSNQFMELSEFKTTAEHERLCTAGRLKLVLHIGNQAG